MEILGVEINLNKSLVSTEGWFEFAKRLCHSDIDISPLGSKAVTMGAINPNWISVAVIDAAQKGCVDQTDGIAILEKMVIQKLLKPSQVDPIYEGLFGPGGIASEVPSLTAWADRKLKHLRVIPIAVESLIVRIHKEFVERKLERFYTDMIGKKWDNPIDFWNIRGKTTVIRSILGFCHPISWWWDYKIQLIREEIW
jgi:hypothetical protein